MNFPRSSGILLHPTSLPGPFGIGDLGPEAYRFVDFLAETHQHLWQILPLGPTGFGDCPYLSFSAFAGNPLLISPERLAEENLLTTSEITAIPRFPLHEADYNRAVLYKTGFLEHSYREFKTRMETSSDIKKEFKDFRDKNSHWLSRYSMFMALKDTYKNRSWITWDVELMKRFNAELAGFREYEQYQFFKQWTSLKTYANGKGIRIIGDIPIYVSHDSADVWAHPELFQLDEKGNPTVVAGVPPDYFSKTGQLWGNPIYRWDRMALTGYKWWIERFRALLTLVDIVRLDHFRGFEAYWEVPASEKTALHGRWVKGPGASFFETLREALGDLPIIAEDLGLITPEVEALRDRFELPGMRVLQFSFGGDPSALPDTYPPRCVVYTGTHDNNTTVGWFWEEGEGSTTRTREERNAERARALAYLKTDGRQIHWDFIRVALASPAQMAIIPMQDLLGLGSEGRMNLPGRPEGNWRWRLLPPALTGEIQERLKGWTLQYGRG